MKQILTTAILTASIFTAAFVSEAAERTLPQKARAAAQDTKEAIVDAAHGVGRAARIGWHKTKEFFSDDMPVYHEGARATLTALTREIADLRARTPVSAPNYFRTRLVALDEQQMHLAGRLALLTREELRERTYGPRFDFDRCIADLEQAIDQAQNGADTLAVIAAK